MEEVFTDILDNDEKIVKVIKPKKCVMYFKSFFKSILMLLFFFVFLLIGVFSASIDDPEFALDSGIALALIPIGIIFIVFILLQWLLLALSYKNLYYAYTNKRIIIRKGIIGVDFKSLDIKMIGATDVHVSILDKILKKNTGTLCFGSTASPLINSSDGVNSFTFNNIEKPYDLYKEIKSYIADNNSKEEK